MVRDEDDGAILHEGSAEAFADELLGCVRIDSAEDVVEDDGLAAGVDGAREGDTGLLAPRKGDSLFSDLSLVCE